MTNDNLDLGSHSLPVDALSQAIGVIGRRGSGKTHTASVLMEEFVSHGLPVTVLDPLGVWWGLRSSADGEHEGLPVTILGGAHGDVPLESTAGGLIADLIVEHSGAYVVDFSAFESRAQERRFALDFAERLFRAKAKEPSAMHLIVDEADTFAPQRTADGDQRLLGSFEAIARRGRVRGLGLTVITQRPASLNKNVLSQVEVLIAHQVTSPQDRAALKAWAEGHATKEQVDDFLESLAGLQIGEAWLWSPSWLQTFERVTIRRRTTFDSSATPKAGEVKGAPRVLAPVDLDVLRQKMAATLEKAEADDPKRLKAEIVRLQRQLADKTPPDCGHEGMILEMQADLERHALEIGRLRIKLQDLLGGARALQEQIEEVLEAAPTPQPEPEAQERVVRIERPKLPEKVDTPTSVAVGTRVGASQQRILDALSAFRAVGVTEPKREHVAIFAEASPGSGTYANNLGALRTAGLIDYPKAGLVTLTDAGMDAANPPSSVILTLSALHNTWAKMLKSAPQTRILQALIARYPRDASRDELADEVGASASSGTYANNLGRLRGLGLIDYPVQGRVVATALLFPEGLSW